MVQQPARFSLPLLVVTIAAAALIHVSIAASQVLLGVGIVLFLLSHGKLPFPRIYIPLAALFFWTALADVLSPDPWGGRAQLKKFFVFFFLPLLYGVFREHFQKVSWLMAAWTLTATASGFWGLVQFILKYRHARQTGEDFYVTYVGHRITGFESHWMTFGALQLAVLSLLLANWLFSTRKQSDVFLHLGLPVLFVAIILGETRSIWLALVPSVIYLLWCWQPKMVLLVPVVAGLAYVASPATTQQRFQSLLSPHGETDSNRHRIVTFRTGVEMIKAHPIFGLGPEQIRRNLDAYVPADIQKPLPVGFYGHLHNIYVQYAAERGLPALFFVLWLIGWTLLDCARAIRRIGRNRSPELFVLHGTVAVTIGILVGGCFEYNLGDSEVLMMFVSVLGLAYAAVYQVEHSQLEPHAAPSPVGIEQPSH